MLVCCMWLLYFNKSISFISAALQQPSFSFLHVYNVFPKTKRLLLLLLVELILFLPVLFYAGLILAVAWQQAYYTAMTFIIVYLLALMVGAAFWYVYQLDQLHKKPTFLNFKILAFSWPSLYPVQLFRFVIKKQAA